MQLVGKAYDRAFAYRKATGKLYEQRLTRVPHAVVPKVDALVDDLPFQSVNLQTTDIAELVSECDIDHAIGPVPHTMGGSTAGYRRWDSFREKGLSRYARLRNNALIDGVSRMSAYLHYGMVSPMRIAREAADINDEGSAKYLDELLVWRESAYAFCFYRRDHERISALPDWAIASLAEHAADERPALLSWETLARGWTGDALWDAAQQSLLMHGELHNNVRMTWGKAILNWTADAKRALAMMIDLNHRYALDGRDPASYGGILWCLGQFDRPFPPARQVFGTVRDRSSAQHAKRLDPVAYRERTTRPLNNPMPTVAVVGAGISGLVCARTLADHGYSVTVFEKSRGVGGRMATRRTDNGFQFDHGAQYFTARDGRFRRYVSSWMDDGIVSPWQGRIVVLENGEVTGVKSGTDRYVAVPRMNAICKHLATDLDIQFQTRIAPLEREGKQWRIAEDEGITLGLFDVAVVSAPAGQTAELLQVVPSLADRARDTVMQGCWAVMLAFPGSLGLDFEGAFVHGSPLSWISRNNSKPGRNAEAETWVLHASAEWTHAHLEEPAESIAQMLTEEFWPAIGLSATRPDYSVAHRWRYALPTEPLAESCLFDPEMKVAACGDWCGGPRVEGAFLSGVSAAGRVMGLLKTEHSSIVPSLEQRSLF
jgi:predicted NAD/FAD-dependent oxidoreductase